MQKTSGHFVIGARGLPCGDGKYSAETSLKFVGFGFMQEFRLESVDAYADYPHAVELGISAGVMWIQRHQPDAEYVVEVTKLY